MMRRAIPSLILLLVMFAYGCEKKAHTPSRPVSPAVHQLIEICTEAQKQYALFYAGLKEHDGDEAVAYATAHNPDPAVIDRLITFEETHRGTGAGLMAAYQLVTNAGRTLATDSSLWRGRHAVLPTLDAYAGLDGVEQVLYYLKGGGYDPLCGTALRQLIAAPATDAADRVRAELCLARWLQMPEARARGIAAWLEDLELDPAQDPSGRRAVHVREALSSLPAADERAQRAGTWTIGTSLMTPLLPPEHPW